MAFLGLKIPHEMTKLLAGVEVPGERIAASDLHVTILYFGEDVPIGVLAKCMEVAYGITSATRPFLCGINKVSSFPPGEDGMPIICSVKSPGLLALNGALRSSFDEAGLEYSKKGDYHPHMTMAYATGEEAAEPYEADLPSPIAWTAMEVVIWGGGHGDDRVSVHLPFTVSPTERMAARLVR